MTKQNHSELESRLAEKIKRREKKKKIKIKVSGSSVKKLQQLIIRKGKYLC
ncbi:hypothetical protein HGA64_05840 [Candidatus Falkowbacteria bacterium]|nr:hypothetical protein [Candidatus Falkowbacteria bacterium]